MQSIDLHRLAPFLPKVIHIEAKRNNIMVHYYENVKLQKYAKVQKYNKNAD